MVIAEKQPQSLADRALAVREDWSQGERVRRAIAGTRLTRVFTNRFASETREPAVWAVGSLSADDLKRLVQIG
jgi:hypothetical protein